MGRGTWPEKGEAWVAIALVCETKSPSRAWLRLGRRGSPGSKAPEGTQQPETMSTLTREEVEADDEENVGEDVREDDHSFRTRLEGLRGPGRMPPHARREIFELLMWVLKAPI